MRVFICCMSKDDIPLPCLKVKSGANPINCKGCNYESQHNKYLDEINNNQKGD